MPRNNVGLKPT